jgi:hypothetical protein
MSKVYFPRQHSPEEWRTMGRGRRNDAADSFERCDTDGFVSQWASGVNARMYDLMAELAEADGFAELDWVIDSETGQPVADWKWIETRYGSSVLIPGAEYGQGRFWNPSHAKKGADRIKRDQAKGFHWGMVRTEVVGMFSGGNARGLAGALNVHPITERRMGAPLELVAEISDRYNINN